MAKVTLRRIMTEIRGVAKNLLNHAATEKRGRILSATLNPVIILSWVLKSVLFTKLPTYSQVACCTPSKIVSDCRRSPSLTLGLIVCHCIRFRHAASFIPRLNPA